MPADYHLPIAILLLRMVVGILFFFQGYDKIFNVGTTGVTGAFFDAVKNSLIPNRLLHPMVVLSSWLEFVCGALLFFGLFRDWALLLMAADLVFVAFAFSSIKAMWDMQYFFPRMAFVVAILLLPAAEDRFSLDAILRAYFP